MSTLTQSVISARPEDLISEAANPAEKQRLQTAVFLKYRSKIAGIARSMLRTPQHWEDAEQAGALGLFAYLDEYVPTEGGTFWGIARFRVIDAIRKWIDVGVYWAPRSARAEGDPRRLQNECRSVHSSYDPELDGRAETLTPEDIAGEHELQEKLSAFVSTLREDERSALFRTDAGVGRRMSLMERARTALKGSES